MVHHSDVPAYRSDLAGFRHLAGPTSSFAHLSRPSTASTTSPKLQLPQLKNLSFSLLGSTTAGTAVLRTSFVFASRFRTIVLRPYTLYAYPHPTGNLPLPLAIITLTPGTEQFSRNSEIGGGLLSMLLSQNSESVGGLLSVR